MHNKKYGEFDSFDDFFNDILSDLDDSHVLSEDAVEDKNTAMTADGILSSSLCSGHNKESESLSHKSVPRIRKHSEPKKSDSASSYLPGRKALPTKKYPKSAFTNSGSLFLSVLFTVTVIAWALPLRPTTSDSEKRDLDTFPDFAVSDLLSGEYFSSIESWFADTFTFRDRWMSLSDHFKQIYGINDVVIYGDTTVHDAIPIPVSDEHNDSQSVAKNEEMKSSVSDLTPSGSSQSEASLDTEWGGLSIMDDVLIADTGGKLMIGDSVFVYPGFNEDCARQYAELMNSAADLLKDKANFYCIIAPHNVSSMLTRDDREKYGFVIEEDALDFIYSLMDSSVGRVNVLKNLQVHNNEYITFRTDPHWTAVGAYYAYEEWCRVASKKPVPLAEYEEVVWEDFYGSYYYASWEPKNLKDNPDDVHAFVPPGDVHLYLDFSNSDNLGEEYDILLDRSVMKVDQYITFLTSDQAKATLTNNSIDDESACLVLKTSFGNPFVYYLTQHYHTVYVVDMRYYNNRGIVSFTEEFNVSDVIMIHATDLCYSLSGISTVKALIR